MAIAEWSRRRCATVLIAGAICEAALLIVPGVLARRNAERNLPRIEQELARLQEERASVDGRWRLTEQADSLSVAAQRRAAIAAGQFTVDPQGDTVVAVVRTPSGRPDSVATAASLARTTWMAVAIVLMLWGIVPIVLLIISVRWLVGRKANSRFAPQGMPT